MKQITNFIGIDISKKTLDICLIDEHGTLTQLKIENHAEAILNTLKSLFDEQNLTVENTLICAEHTGHYTNILDDVMRSNKYLFWLADPYTIKHSQGIKRGKNDAIDAQRIALFAKRNMDDAKMESIDNKRFKDIAYLRSQRELMVTDCAKYSAQLKDEKNYFSKEMYLKKQHKYLKIIALLKENIKEIEAEINAIIKSDEMLKKQFEIIKSIDGIGPQTALETIITTEGFTKFSNPRAFACHAGCAPFKYESGTSIRSKNRISFRSNKSLKSLFHMSALSCINMKKGELKDYYNRKVAEGKNKMCVLNAMRNKLIHRIFALIKSDRFYEKNIDIYLQNP